VTSFASTSDLEVVRSALGADVALLLTPDGDRLRVRARVGDHAEHLPGAVLTPPGSVLGAAIADGGDRRLTALPLLAAPGSGRARRLGPALVVSTPWRERHDAVLVVARHPGGRLFHESTLVAVAFLVAGWAGAALGAGRSP
jgi:hypothetical protein